MYLTKYVNLIVIILGLIVFLVIQMLCEVKDTEHPAFCHM